MTITLNLGLSYYGLAITSLITAIIFLFIYLCKRIDAMAEGAFICWILYGIPAILTTILGVLCAVIGTWLPGCGYEWIPLSFYLLTLSWTLYWRFRC